MKLNKFSPYEEFTLKCNLTPEEVRERFIVNVEPIKAYRFIIFRMPKKIYEGEIDGNQFVMHRILRATSYKILIWGHILPIEKLTLIKIKMEYELHIKVLNVTFFIILGLFSFLLLIAGIQMGSILLSLAGFSLFIIVYLIKNIGFKDEINDAKRFLERLFDGREIKE